MDQTTFGARIKIVLGIAAGLLGVWFLYEIRGILAPFVLAFVLAYVLTPLVDRLEGRGLGRTLSILLIFLLTFASVVLGTVVAGKTLFTEMVGLSVEFMRQDTVDAELKVTNRGEISIAVASEWGEPLEGNPFRVLEPELPLELAAGETLTIRLQFAPADTIPASGILHVLQTGADEGHQIRLRGNTPTDPLASQVDDWAARYQDPVTLGALVVSAGGIDFGQAGPNVISRVSAFVATDIEPSFQSIITVFSPDQEIDVAQLIKTHGRKLIDVLLGGTTDVLEGLWKGVASGLVLVVVVPFVAFFFLREGRRISHGMIELVPNAYFELCLNLIHQINGQIGGYIRGQLLAVTIVATLAWSGLSLIGVPYALPVGVLAGLSNMIPYLGPLIGIVSASIVALATLGGFAMVIKVIVVFLIIQLLDNVVIQPLVVARSVDLHPLIVLTVVMIGSDLMGIVGMLVAVPLTGILKVSAKTIYEGVKGYRAR